MNNIGRNHKLGLGVSKKRVLLNTIQRNINNRLLKLDMNEVQKNYILAPIIEETKADFDELSDIIDDSDVLPLVHKCLHVVALNDIEIHESKERVLIGSIDIVSEANQGDEIGIYQLNLQMCINADKSGFLNYIQYMVCCGDNRVMFNSHVINSNSEKGYKHSYNVCDVLDVKESKKLDVYCIIGYSTGVYSFDACNSKMSYLLQ